MTKIKKLEVVGPLGISARDVQFALRLLSVGVILALLVTVFEGRV